MYKTLIHNTNYSLRLIKLTLLMMLSIYKLSQQKIGNDVNDSISHMRYEISIIFASNFIPLKVSRNLRDERQ